MKTPTKYYYCFAHLHLVTWVSIIQSHQYLFRCCCGIILQYTFVATICFFLLVYTFIWWKSEMTQLYFYEVSFFHWTRPGAASSSAPSWRRSSQIWCRESTRPLWGTHGLLELRWYTPSALITFVLQNVSNVCMHRDNYKVHTWSFVSSLKKP